MLCFGYAHLIQIFLVYVAVTVAASMIAVACAYVKVII